MPPKNDKGKKISEKKKTSNTDKAVARSGDSSSSDDTPTDGKAAGGNKIPKKRELQAAQARLDTEDRARKDEIRAQINAQEGEQFSCSQTPIAPNDQQWQNALDIVIPEITISAYRTELLSSAELRIAQGKKYGLVGQNGAGKSTLLKMIAYGKLKIPPKIDCLYVEQEIKADDTSAVNAVLMADKKRWDLIQEEARILAEIEKLAINTGSDQSQNQETNETLDEKLGEMHSKLAEINASAAEPKARRILFGLGFTAEMQSRPTKLFSGGWRMRISLARALFIEPTLLMLDEPTNHLDMNAVIWLEDYLTRWKKTLLIVSHDQNFLNSVTQEIIHVENKKLVPYSGNYDTFKELEKIKHKNHVKAYKSQENKITEIMAKNRSRSEAEEIFTGGGRELLGRPKEYSVVFKFPDVPKISSPVIQVNDVCFKYPTNVSIPALDGASSPMLLRNVNFGIDMKSRICIVGPNGSGKSTLLKLITGELQPTTGEILRNGRVRLGVYNQHFVDRFTGDLTIDKTPVEYLQQVAEVENRRMFGNNGEERTFNEQDAHKILGKFGLESRAHTLTMRDLSGGQKSRVAFAELYLMEPHVLLLDEPTNNLDIESIDALCDALKVDNEEGGSKGSSKGGFKGGVVLVSHDSRLIESTNCKLWVVEDHGVTVWNKDFEDYRDYLLEQMEEQMSIIVPGSGERRGENVMKTGVGGNATGGSATGGIATCGGATGGGATGGGRNSKK